ENSVSVQHRRSRGAPAVADLHGRPTGGPELFPFHVVTEEAYVAVVSIDALAVGHRRFGSEGVLHVQPVRRGAGMSFLPPEFATGVEVEAEDEPTLGAFGNLLAFAAEIKALLRLFHFAFAHDGRHEDAIAPHNGRRPTAPGHVDLPRHIFVG